MPDVTRRVVGRYEILRELGRGGMSTVHLARQTDLDRCVALKELHAWDPSVGARLLRESQLAGSLSHPNIVTVFDYFERDGTPYIAMEYVERGSLRPFVGRMTLARIGGVLEGLLAGLRHAEEHGIVHRDLKPENLMVTADGRVKIADFGIAAATTATQAGASSTVTGVTVGTPDYMAPEQATAGPIGPWTDLYSVGCIAFELFTGRTPFAGSGTPIATLLRQVNESIPSVKSLVPDVDARISDWIEQLLVKQPAWRTQHAGDAWAALEEILVWLLGPLWRRDAPLVAMPLAPEPVGERPGPAVTDRPSPARGRRTRALSAAIAGGIAVVAGVAAAALGADGRERPRSVQPAPVELSARGIALELPPGWRSAPGGEAALAGVDDPTVARGPGGQRIVSGRGDWSWANHHLLPRALYAGRRGRRSRPDTASGPCATTVCGSPAVPPPSSPSRPLRASRP